MLCSAPSCVAASLLSKGLVFRNVSTPYASCGNTGFRYMVSNLKASMHTVHTSCKRASMPSFLANSQGLLASTYTFTLSAKSMVSRSTLPKSRLSYNSCMLSFCALMSLSNCCPSSVITPNLWSNFLARNPAARLAMLMYLPTKSLFTRARKSSALKSMSSLRALNLAAK